MFLKFIQVNIYKGKYFDALVDFIKKEDPDFISMQEVTTNGFNFYVDKTVNLFDLLTTKLEMYGAYHGDLKLKGDTTSVFGNAVFSKYPIVYKNVLQLKSFRPVTIEELDANTSTVRELIDRHILDAQVDLGGRTTHILSWHGAWTAPPHDSDETYRQANLVYSYLKKIESTYILGGDINAVSDGKTIKLISSIANNFMDGTDVKVTTNLKVHKIAPRGYLIDYIFASQDIKLLNLRVPEITVSDHLPVIAELEI